MARHREHQPRRRYMTRESRSRVVSYTLPLDIQRIVDDRMIDIIKTQGEMMWADGQLNPNFVLNLSRAAFMQGFLDGKGTVR